MARTPNATPPAPDLNGADTAIEVAHADGDGINLDTTPSVEVETATSADPALGGTGDEGISSLQQQLDAANARASNAEAEAARLRTEQNAANREVADNRVLVLDATIKRQEGEKQDLLRQKIEAKEAGDYKLEAEVDDKLQQLNIDLKATKLGKARLESDIEEMPDPAAQPGSKDDPLEAYIRENNFHPRAANWLRNHRDYVDGSNPAKVQSLTRAHNFAMGHDGVEMNSERYFELIEQKLGIREAQVDVDAGQQEEQQPQRQQQRAPAAPVSRGTPLNQNGGRVIMEGIVELSPGKYRVSPAMAAHAAELGMSVKDYVDNAVALKNSGQLH